MVIVLKDADFRNANIGQIDIPTANLLSLRIEGADSVEGLSSSYVCKAVYDDNSERIVTSLVTWSIVDDTYATISNGVLNIKSSANNNTVQITVSWNSKYASKSVTVTFLDTISSDAQAIIEAYGNKTLSTDQRHAFDDFYADFASKSWKDNVKALLIPILHTPTTETLDTTTKLNNTNVGYDIISKSKKFSFSSQAYSQSYGIAKVGDYGIQKDLNASFVNNFKLLFSISSLNLTDSNFSMIYGMKRTNSVQIQTGVSSLNHISYAEGKLRTPPIYQQYNYSSLESNGYVVGVNIPQGTTGWEFLVNGSKDTNNPKTSSSGFTGNAISSVGVLAGTGLSDGSIGLIAIGTGFDNNSDFEEFSDMCKTLMDSLWGNTQTTNNESSGNESNE